MENTTPKLGIIESDPWLEPYSAAIEGRHMPHQTSSSYFPSNGASPAMRFTVSSTVSGVSLYAFMKAGTLATSTRWFV